MSTVVSYELRDGIAELRMDDGKVNVLSLQMLSELNAALDRAGADRAGVLLTGRAGVFCAGFDLGVLRNGGAPARDMLIGGFELAERLLSFATPVVIACSGHALAMGSFLLLAADFRIGASGAYRIGANEVAIGLTMPHFAVEICRQRLAPAHFNRAVINAEIYAPEQAVTAGFLDQVVASAQLPGAAADAAAALAKLDMAAHAATKQRARAQALERIRAAIEADDAAIRGRQLLDTLSRPKLT